MKTLSLIKAAFSQDMNMFKYSSGTNASKFKKVIVPILLFLIVCFAIGTYSFMMADALSPYNMTYIMLSMFIMIVTIISFIEGIYKSQGILFDAKDNDLLFSLPIKRSQILLVRILKLLTFQYIFNLMFLLPAFFTYIYYENPPISFYGISFLMSFLIPIIPTVLTSFLGYGIKMFSAKFKARKIIETIVSGIVFLVIFILSMKLDSFINNLVNYATSINDIIIKIYYPIGLYINLINNFQIIDLIKLLLVNLIPLVIFILIATKFYFKVISQLSENSLRKKLNNKKELIIKRKPLIALIRKEIKRYFSSPVYMFNTSFGLLLLVLVSVLLLINGVSKFEQIISLTESGRELSLPVIFYFFVLIVGTITSISSSSISLEGKTINITKSLPISENLILKSKILTCFVIELPFFIISILLFIIKVKPSLLLSLLIIILSFVIIFLIANIGLITNLKYPKMNANNDTEVVKQSMSAMIAIFIGMGITVSSIFIVFYFNEFLDIELLLVGHLILILMISIILYHYLMKKGVSDYRKINV